MKKISIVFLFWALLFSGYISGKDDIQPEYSTRKICDIAFLAVDMEEENIQPLLKEGVSAFILQGKNSSNRLQQYIPDIKKHLDTHLNSIIFIFIKGNINQTDLTKMIDRFELKNILFDKKNDLFHSTFTSIIKSGKRLVLFSENENNLSLSFNNNVCFIDYNNIRKSRKNICSENENKLICYYPFGEKQFYFEEDSLFKQSFHSWIYKATFPNFIAVKPNFSKKLLPVIDSLNNCLHFTGVVNSKNKILSGLHWKFKKTYCESNGRFSFPKLKSDYSLYVPWKEGYKFYPEVIKFDENTQHYDITATRLELSEQMIYHFSFENKAMNEVDQKSEAQLFEIDFATEKERGKVASFKNKQSGIQLNNLNHFSSSRPFTISAWVKPATTDRIQTILSKGEIFSAKIRYDDLSFAGTTFNSKISAEQKIKPNVWQLITYVYVPDYHIQFFINGKLIFEDDMALLPDNEQSLTIGNNFSNEYFQGEMDDLKVWNRALSMEEVEKLFQLRSDSGSNYLFYLLIVAVISMILFFYFRTAKNRKTNKTKSKSTNTNIQQEKNSIYLFGNLSIMNEIGENLTPMLSPKVKQLFLLLLINRKGVTIQTINDELWPGMDEEKAKQNRNYNIQQIKKILQKTSGIQLEYKSKHWKLEISDHIYVDYFAYESLSKVNISNHYSDKNINQEIINVLERGKFLQGTDAEIFDAIKGKIADNIIEQLLNMAEQADNKARIKIGNILLMQDSLSEEGLKLVIKSLSEAGRKGEANEVYIAFSKRYQKIYNEEFSVKFNDLI